MKIAAIALVATATTASAFAPATFGVRCTFVKFQCVDVELKESREKKRTMMEQEEALRTLWKMDHARRMETRV